MLLFAYFGTLGRRLANDPHGDGNVRRWVQERKNAKGAGGRQ
jgi:hypothetical protein